MRLCSWPFGTKYRTTELDSHLSAPRLGAAIARPVWRDTAKFSLSHAEFFTSSMHISLGVGDEHMSMPTWKSRLKDVQPPGSGTLYQLPPRPPSLDALDALSTGTGANECMHNEASLQS